MAQVVDKSKKHLLPDNIRGALQSLGPHGIGPAAWDRNIEAISQAAQSLQHENAAFEMQVQDRARRIQFEDQDRRTQEAYDKLKLLEKSRGILSQEQAQADTKTMGEQTPFDSLLAQKSVPEPARQQLEQAKGIYARLGSTAARQAFTEQVLPGIAQTIDQAQREQFKSGMADRASRLAYGEDDAVAEGLNGLTQLVDSGAPLAAVAQQEQQLRVKLAESKAKMAKKQRMLGLFTQRAAAISPGPHADRAERAVIDFDAELIDEKQAMEAMVAAELGLDVKPPAKPPAAVYMDAANAARQMFGPDAKDPEAILKVADKIFERMMQLQQAEEKQPSSPGSNQPGGLPFEQSSAPQEAKPAPAATPMQTMQSVEQAKQLTGKSEKDFKSWYAERSKTLGIDPNPDDPEHFYDYRAAFQAGAEPDAEGHWPSKFKKPGHPREIIDGINTRTGEHVDRAGAIKQAEEAAKAGASREQIAEILRAAGLDPEGPPDQGAEAKPKKKRRQAERVGPNV